ncbi:hypothetical protein PV327_010996 [Microctonus hyperodae]|uniref:Uncharacterized protein n=1 Tax=Microctonus hyperodae TaxID=165561 RepID=A0AA39KUJ6_MICHY|nr:hypothetical protein PV327_010996 [Microctonus hyperodae]
MADDENVGNRQTWHVDIIVTQHTELDTKPPLPNPPNNYACKFTLNSVVLAAQETDYRPSLSSFSFPVSSFHLSLPL